MRVDAFDFELPENLIAVRPAIPRGSSRLMVVEHERVTDAQFPQLPDWLRAGDVLVFNDTRVIPARLYATRGQGKVELLLHKRLSGSPEQWECFARPAKKLKTGDVLALGEGFSAEVLGKDENGLVRVSFAHVRPFHEHLHEAGNIPLPPYIEKLRPQDARDREDYQTVYAAKGKEGAVAAPTAGLHFTPELLSKLQACRVECRFITLHVGAGTFLPVKAEDTRDHVMHSEWLEISRETAQAINGAKARGGRIVAIGTTALRALESAADENGTLTETQMETNIFITPGYRFKCADMLLTNFHLPKSTLFMLVSAFSGLTRMREAYRHAIERHYRFYSYGDAMLLFKEPHP